MSISMLFRQVILVGISISFAAAGAFAHGAPQDPTLGPDPFRQIQKEAAEAVDRSVAESEKPDEWSSSVIKQLPAAPGTEISPEVSQQVIVATATKFNSGDISWYEWDGEEWQLVGANEVVFGKGGVKYPNNRVEGDASTPTGTYGFLTQFGDKNVNEKNMPFKQMTKCSYWNSRGTDKNYNRWVEDCVQRKPGWVHLRSNPEFKNAAALDFNYENPIRPPAKGSGSGVMLHYKEPGFNTTGCIGVTNKDKLLSILRWMDPTKNPKIVIQKAGF